MSTSQSTVTPDLNIERFWHDNELGVKDPFGAIPQVPMALGMGYECVFDELGIPEDRMKLQEDYEHAGAVARAYNDKAEAIVGRRLLDEQAYDPTRQMPRLLDVGEIFGCRREWHSESWWFMEAAHTPAELSALLDRIEKLDLRPYAVPDPWEDAARKLYARHGIRARFPMDLRGPVTCATSIYGVENLIYLIEDEPTLAARFRDVLLKVVLEIYRMRRDAMPADLRRPGFSFRDDNCCMLTPDMYAFFGQPILRAVYDEFAPAPEDRRYQHSDSDMGHLLPLLAEVGMNAVNFGPNVRFSHIRQAMPNAVVYGTMAPYTFMRNDADQIVFELRRDIQEARPTRGLVETTAGSINNGSRLTSLRLVMATLQAEGRYAD